MNECCRKATTPYCGICGTKLADQQLRTLLAYLKAKEDRARYRLQLLENSYGDVNASNLGDERGFRNLEKARREFSKWNGWVRLVDNIIAEPRMAR